MTSCPLPPFTLLAPPYFELLPLNPAEGFASRPEVHRGLALVWSVESRIRDADLGLASSRPPGVPLIVVLPSGKRAPRNGDRILELVEEARPHALLPSPPAPEPEELARILRAEPEELAGDFLDYLFWRGLRLDQETRRVVRRFVELSGEVRSLTAAARGVYLSRRALGRRFRDRGLPVPSHWLQFFRTLRAALKLQNSTHSLHEVARSLGYPDGFTLSNQMNRLLGLRPSDARERLGWEWIVEAWLDREARTGGLTVPLRGLELAMAANGVEAHAEVPLSVGGAKRNGAAA